MLKDSTSHTENLLASTQQSTATHQDYKITYDWTVFTSAYASGRWDPHRTPNPPSGLGNSSIRIQGASPMNMTLGSKQEDDENNDAEQNRTPTAQTPSVTSSQNVSPTVPLAITPSTITPSITKLSTFSRAPTYGYPPVAPASATAAHFPSSQLPTQFHSNSPVHASSSRLHDFPNAPTLNAATLRLAGTHVNIAPLALPSPEHELTDPMRTAGALGRNFMVTVPGGRWLENSDSTNSLVTTPGGTTRRIRISQELKKFWKGTRDVDGPLGTYNEVDNELHRLTIDDARFTSSPQLTLLSSTSKLRETGESNAAPTSISIPAPSLSAYTFPYPYDRTQMVTHPTGAMSVPATTNGASNHTETITAIENPTDSDSSIEGQPVRRVTLMRQSSAPLPVAHGTLSSSVSIEAFGALINVGQSPSMRAAKEEHMFRELGYLPAPNPPDELERRRALYKFNIWNTGSDLNFDRIAHLAKLVFNTKGVFISLLDGNEQCDDEPMVILDTLQDWRFSNNPHVVNAPHVRFYAGAPLRTQDGHNVGSLAVIDDAPRNEFTPRLRHTLKEFAAIAMREMELWRDKIQLRIRDRIQNSMEQFSRECLEIDMEQQDLSMMSGSSMDRVYDRAAKLVQRTLDVEGVIVMDVSHCEVLENMSGESTINVVMHHGDPDVTETTTKCLNADEYAKLNAFFAKNPDGKISEGIVPPSFRLFLPTTRIQYALTVPIYNIDKRPFALLCAYNASEHTKRFLLVSVIILSAVLKRRMLLADKAKSLFISNISHELRTPLHGILAAAELLSESDLNHSQLSFLQTIQACGTSLVETVNHVLDFTKLSGNSKAGGVENVIISTKVDLMQLVEEAVDGCWIGHRARTAIMEDTGTGIGSVYSPPKEDEGKTRKHVEAIIDIGESREGWVLKCEKGGIRRVLMNIFGNSLKFTSNGFVHVILRELPPAEGDPPNKVKVELAVHDTGKGISQNFLKDQLFHPFSQENPLQAGTGLGLAIVNSIVTSDSVGGKVDVWSEENVGTEIKITFPAEVVEGDKGAEMGSFNLNDFSTPPTVSLVGFENPHKGIQLLRSVLKTYITSWWGLEVQETSNSGFGNIVVLNEDISLVVEATSRHDTSRPFIVLSALRGNPIIMSAASEHELIGGLCRVIHKPGGPSRIRSVLRLCLHALKIGSKSARSSSIDQRQIDHQSATEANALSTVNPIVPRRNSEDSRLLTPRPSMSPRSTTAHPVGPSSWNMATSTVVEEKADSPEPDANEPTITLDSGGTLLKSSIGSIETKSKKVRVLIIEDNLILRGLLVKWLSKKGFYYRDAVDGRDGVNAYEKDGPFDIVLLDLSMPILDGIGATAEIRKIESSSTAEFANRRSRILALTGMSSLEDKRRAFEAGVDGYLVKPVPFSTLNEVFFKLGIS
ncbi:atypical/HisK protein kinase [Lentinula aciculospora]|uniref:histidine kinase n=1 Tax=Lentinula aciculospora TaxID=153920 RepID=A0A9W9DPC9_9AGAR|nr:atypical/HisK protein kinase [Lentinula aciculospora]